MLEQIAASLSQFSVEEEIFAASAVGVASHLLFFKNGEHHMEAPLLLWTHIIVFTFLLYANTAFGDVYHGTVNTIALFSAYLISLWSSIVIYRLFFHRLRKFPGPRMLSVSKLWHTAHCFHSQNHIFLDNLHKQYGDFVRTGMSSSRNSDTSIANITHKAQVKSLFLLPKSNGQLTGH
jgi:hypothetical protein